MRDEKIIESICGEIGPLLEEVAKEWFKSVIFIKDKNRKEEIETLNDLLPPLRKGIDGNYITLDEFVAKTVIIDWWMRFPANEGKSFEESDVSLHWLAVVLVWWLGPLRFKIRGKVPPSELCLQLFGLLASDYSKSKTPIHKIRSHVAIGFGLGWKRDESKDPSGWENNWEGAFVECWHLAWLQLHKLIPQTIGDLINEAEKSTILNQQPTSIGLEFCKRSQSKPKRQYTLHDPGWNPNESNLETFLGNFIHNPLKPNTNDGGAIFFLLDHTDLSAERRPVYVLRLMQFCAECDSESFYQPSGCGTHGTGKHLRIQAKKGACQPEHFIRWLGRKSSDEENEKITSEAGLELVAKPSAKKDDKKKPEHAWKWYKCLGIKDENETLIGGCPLLYGENGRFLKGSPDAKNEERNRENGDYICPYCGGKASTQPTEVWVFRNEFKAANFNQPIIAYPSDSDFDEELDCDSDENLPNELTKLASDSDFNEEVDCDSEEDLPNELIKLPSDSDFGEEVDCDFIAYVKIRKISALMKWPTTKQRQVAEIFSIDPNLLEKNSDAAEKYQEQFWDSVSEDTIKTVKKKIVEKLKEKLK